MKKILVMLLLLLAICGTAAFGQDYTGVLNNAPYKIRVPAGWNGELLLYGHGYGMIERFSAAQFDYSYADAAPGGQAMEDFLLSQGYALAGSVFSGTGWQVKEGTHDLVSLAGLFNGLVGKPKRTILIGYSMGSLIAFKSAEDMRIYDGVIAGCGQGAGTSKGMDLAGDFSLAYATLFGWPSGWGKNWSNVEKGLKFYSDVYPVLLSQMTNLQNFPKFEFIRLLMGVPFQGAYENPGWMSLGMFIATEARADLQSRARGPVVQNANHYYSLTDAQKAYLVSLGMPARSIDGVLAAMNAQTNVTVASPQKKYLEKYFDPTGDLDRPLITMHEIGDGLVGAYNETVLAETVKSAGSEDLLVQTFTNGNWHCGFTAPQLLSTIKAMDFWLDTGTKPDLAFFPETLGFAPASYVPPQWPIGTKSR